MEAPLHSLAHLGAKPRTSIKLVVPLLALICAMLLIPSHAGATGTIAITSGPPEGTATNARPISFGLSYVTSATKEVDFYCSMDSEFLFYPCQNVSFPSCTSNGATKTCTQISKEYLVTEQRAYVFRAFASECDSPCDPNADGLDGPIAARSFIADRIAPTLTFVSGPSVAKPVIKGKPTFVVSTSEPARLSCSKDLGVTSVACASPIVLGAVRNGRRTLSITAIDPAGNRSAPLVLSYKVDIFKPKKCKRSKRGKRMSRKAKIKYKKCRKANARAKARWKKRNR
ncbi:MAG: hypothetical protein ACPGWS_01545 [Solirubrobacterales bacterium]